MNAALLAGLAEAISDREVVRFDLPADAARAYLGQGLNADRRRVRLVVRARSGGRRVEVRGPPFT
ncbi:hypothetical protein ACIBI0_20690 [Microbispora rosea]|uniref:hypothetical protein n=1 Tax=Microbispora rosea TaxID=58117 RepID=UPI003797D3E4